MDTDDAVSTSHDESGETLPSTPEAYEAFVSNSRFLRISESVLHNVADLLAETLAGCPELKRWSPPWESRKAAQRARMPARASSTPPARSTRAHPSTRTTSPSGRPAIFRDEVHAGEPLSPQVAIHEMVP